MRKRNQDQTKENEIKETKKTKEEKLTSSDERDQKPKPYKYGPLPRFSGQRLWSKIVIITGVLLYVWYYSKDSRETVLAKQDKMYSGRGQNVACNEEYTKEISEFPGCAPKQCGRYVSDKVVTAREADILLGLAKRGMALGGSSGGATILDLHSGALSLGEKFVNIYKHSKNKFLTATDVAIYKIIRTKIQFTVAETFGLDRDSIYLTHPTFFSRFTNVEPKTVHDEYWLIHIDKHTYESFHYTSLLYLNDYGIDFKGGRFIYLDKPDKPKKNVTVEPRKGRLSLFTSGAENPHYVEKVTDGERYAITVSFTCDKTKAIKDPLLN